MFDIRVFNALATQTSIKIGQIPFNVTTPSMQLVRELVISEPAWRQVGHSVHCPLCFWPYQLSHAQIASRLSSAVSAAAHPDALMMVHRDRLAVIARTTRPPWLAMRSISASLFVRSTESGRDGSYTAGLPFLWR